MLGLLYFPVRVGFTASTAILSQSRQLLYVILYRLPLLTLVLWLSLSGGRSLRQSRGWKQLTGKDCLLMLGLPVLTLSAGLIFRSENAPLQAMDWNTLILFIALSVVTAVSEELLFRSWILSEYRNRMETVPLILIAALLFAGTHTWQGAGPTLFAFGVGILYSCLFLRQSNIWIFLGAHCIHNTLAIVLANIR